MPPRLALEDLRVGLVLHLDPDAILGRHRDQVAIHLTWNRDRIIRPGYFVVAWVSGTDCWLVPLTSQPGPRADRELIPRRGKSGHRSWVRRPTFVVGGQIWRIPHTVLLACAAKSDNSTSATRNYVLGPWVPRLDGHVPDRAIAV